MSSNNTDSLSFWIPWVLLAALLLIGMYREREIYRIPPILYEVHQDALKRAAGIDELEQRIDALERQLRDP